MHNFGISKGCALNARFFLKSLINKGFSPFAPSWCSTILVHRAVSKWDTFCTILVQKCIKSIILAHQFGAPPRVDPFWCKPA